MSSVYITKERPKDLQVNILGTTYDILFKTPEEDVHLVECDGYCDNSTHQLVIKWFEWDGMNYNDMLAYSAKVIRHEIVHAFLYQSGLDTCASKDWARHEEMVDWIAIQIYKIASTAQDTEATFYEQNRENVVVEP